MRFLGFNPAAGSSSTILRKPFEIDELEAAIGTC
jgi:hypothetical protein